MSERSFMDMAIDEARAAAAAGEVPVGCTIVRGGEVIASAGNRTLIDRDPTAHAELLAIRAAARALGTERLTECDLYVTLEPCAMCAAAMLHARVERVVFGAWDPRVGAVGSRLNLFQVPGHNHRIDFFGGVLATECGDLLREFFSARR